MKYNVAIIGSGPSGFYAAQALFKSEINVFVDMFEKLPNPYGLLRGGVAPDHQQMKSVSKSYESIAQNDQFRFFGNVNVGQDVKIDELKSYYHAIICCIGAESDRKMNIPGEDANGSHTATEFVAWYNGQPEYQNHKFNLNGKVAVVIGQGNVAVDVTRMLTKSIDELSQTDMTKCAIDALTNSSIEHVYMVGRRGPVQAAFTKLELKELGNLSGVNLNIHHDLTLSKSDQSEIEQVSKSRKNIELLTELKSKSLDKSANKHIHLMFNTSPVEIQTTNDRVSSIRFEKNELFGDPCSQKAIGTGEYFTLNCDLVFRSIGYKGVPLIGVPFDEKRGVIPNQMGQVVDLNNTIVPQLFASGWIKRGPSGVIGTNRHDSFETVDTCLDYLRTIDSEINNEIIDLLNKRNVTYVTFDGWKKINDYEINQGANVGKPREKVTSVKEMLKLASM